MFERYSEIIPDFDGFAHAVRRPMASHIRVNPARIEASEFVRRTAGSGHRFEPLGWYAQGFVVPPTLERPGATLEYALGLYHIQSASSMVPPLVLAPEPGDRVLDLCAAPGSKTTQLCELMADRGVVVANDLFIDRLKVLKSHLERLGHVCAVITRRPGESYPGGLTFRRVLVDAPCSGEGTFRGTEAHGRSRRAVQETADARETATGEPPVREREKLYRLQRALLRRAANLVEPGGIVVYSTCTYDPLENEAVVDDLLRARDDFILEEPPVDVPGAEPGLTCFDGQRFRGLLARARRLYPHRLDSDGFFVARLKRQGDLAPLAKGGDPTA